MCECSRSHGRSFELEVWTGAVVIAHSSLVAAEGEPILEALRAKAPELDAQQVLSTPFTQLRPCLAVVVAGAFATKGEAVALTQRLKTTVVVALAHLWTGDANTECGGEDYEDYVSRIVLRVPGEEAVLLGQIASFGAHDSLPGQLIQGVLDLRGTARWSCCCTIRGPD